MLPSEPFLSECPKITNRRKDVDHAELLLRSSSSWSVLNFVAQAATRANTLSLDLDQSLCLGYTQDQCHNRSHTYMGGLCYYLGPGYHLVLGCCSRSCLVPVVGRVRIDIFDSCCNGE